VQDEDVIFRVGGPRMNKTEAKKYTLEEWRAEAAKRFGDDPMKWKFVCPSCGHVQTPQDYKDAGAPSTAVGFSCVGRWSGNMKKEAFSQDGGPCNYAGGGLFRLNPVTVVDPDGIENHAFDFA
jgi:hypothetical protein